MPRSEIEASQSQKKYNTVQTLVQTIYTKLKTTMLLCKHSQTSLNRLSELWELPVYIAIQEQIFHVKFTESNIESRKCLGSYTTCVFLLIELPSLERVLVLSTWPSGLYLSSIPWFLCILNFILALITFWNLVFLVTWSNWYTRMPMNATKAQLTRQVTTAVRTYSSSGLGRYMYVTVISQ